MLKKLKELKELKELFKLVVCVYVCLFVLYLIYYIFVPKNDIKNYGLDYQFIIENSLIYCILENNTDMDFSNISICLGDKVGVIEVLRKGEIRQLEFEDVKNSMQDIDIDYDNSVINKISGKLEVNKDEFIDYQISYTLIQHRDFVNKNADFLPDCIEFFDYKKDTDGDGLTDWQETCQTNTSPLLVDTDANGIYDKDEDKDKDGMSNFEELVQGSNPLSSDLLEVAEIEEDNTIVGSLTIVSSHSGGILALTAGHAWLVFTANQDIDVNVSNMYAGYVYDSKLSQFMAEQNKGFIHLDKEDSITIGAFGFGRASSLVGNNRGDLGGICYNTEFTMLDNGRAGDMVGYTRVITKSQLNRLISFILCNNYYNFYTHNCVTTAVGAWNMVYEGEEFSGKMSWPLDRYYFPYKLKKEIQKKAGYDNSYKDKMFELLEVVKQGD